MRPFLFLSVLAAIAAGNGVARGEAPRMETPVKFTSGLARAALLELYTSEGCSSCPPAERWLATLREHDGLWRDFVPVAFHVDYWNRLGWPDKFSRKEFTAREYAYATAWRSNSVYTPCFVRDGAEWRIGDEPPAPGAAAGTLKVSYDGAGVRAEFVPGEWELHAALLGGGIASKIGAGENRGATLHHEFVALALASGALVAEAPLALPRRRVDGVTRYALAVWVTRRGELAPVQATGGWLE